MTPYERADYLMSIANMIALRQPDLAQELRAAAHALRDLAEQLRCAKSK